MITIYSKDGCPYCDQAKALLESYAMRYKEIRIDEDDDAREFVLGEGHRAVPQLYVGKRLLVEGGFGGLQQLSPAEISYKVHKLNES